MKTMGRTAAHLLPAVLLLTLLLALSLGVAAESPQAHAFQSPLLTPSPIAAAPTPTPVPREAQTALRYAAEHWRIPVDKIHVDYWHPWEYPLLGRSFTLVKLFDSEQKRAIGVLVDPEDQTIEPDKEAMDRAERSAHRNLYGKLERSLHTRLQGLRNDDAVEVAIWVAGQIRDPHELDLEVAAQFPQAAEALQRHGTPFQIEDQAVRTKVQQAFERMLSADSEALYGPLVSYLKSMGYEPRTLPGLPAVMVKLPRSLVELLQGRDDVGLIYLTERPAAPALDTAISSDRIPSVWAQEVNGLPLDGEGGTRIAIVEAGSADIYANTGLCVSPPCFRHPGGSSGGYGPDDNYQHATLVASAAASDYALYRGAAPGARVYAAGMGADGDWYLLDALHRALSAEAGWYDVDVANVSMQAYCQQDMSYLDRTFDHWVRYYRRIVVVAAGNANWPECPNHWIKSPGKAWNVITAGAYDDNNTMDWSDDQMWWASAYVDPWGDREKPEVVAPGVDITGIGRQGTLRTGEGTSLAAPQVAGTAALMMQRSGRGLRSYPEAVKAILMASAVHNIEGAERLSNYDGAGGLDAALAVRAAAEGHPNGDTTDCYGSCWWDVPFHERQLPNGATVGRYHFYATRGERVRVAAAWLSFAHCPDVNDCPVDQPVDLDLRVYTPGYSPFPSTSVSNNYELVDFTAPESGRYEIAVTKYSGGTEDEEAWNQLGVALVKDATYLPHLSNKPDSDPYQTEVFVRNEGAEPRTVTINYADPTGAFVTSEQFLMQPNEVGYVPTYLNGRVPAGGRGSAIIDGGEDLAVQLVNVRTADGAVPFTADSLTPAALGGSVLRAPLLYANNSTWHSDFVVYNPHAQADQVCVTYDALIGYGCSTPCEPLAANSNFSFNQRYWPDCALSSPFIGGARIASASGRPLLGVAFQWKDAPNDYMVDTRMSYPLLSVGADITYAPLVMRNNTGYNTGWGLQDVSGVAGTATMEYYPPGGQPYCHLDGHAVGANGLFAINPSPGDGGCSSGGTTYVGAGRALRSDSLVGVVNQVRSGTNTAMSYEAATRGSRLVILPFVVRNLDNWWGRSDWGTGLAIQNTSANLASVTVTYYHANGNWADSSSHQIQPLGSVVLNPTPPNWPAFVGSAVVAANQPVAVAVNIAGSAADGADHGMSTLGVAR